MVEKQILMCSDNFSIFVIEIVKIIFRFFLWEGAGKEYQVSDSLLILDIKTIICDMVKPKHIRKK